MSVAKIHRGVENYRLVCYLALLVIFMVQFQQGLLLLNLAIVGAALVSLQFRLRFGPLIFLFLLTIGQLSMRDPSLPFAGAPPVGEDFLLGGAVLIFIAADYRLLSVLTSALPEDGSVEENQGRRRDETTITLGEIVALVLTSIAWVAFGFLFWRFLTTRAPAFEGTRFEPLVRYGWILGVSFFLGRLALQAWSWRQFSRGQARMALRDILWRETRGDQRRIQRWLAWARRRAKGK